MVKGIAGEENLRRARKTIQSKRLSEASKRAALSRELRSAFSGVGRAQEVLGKRLQNAKNNLKKERDPDKRVKFQREISLLTTRQNNLSQVQKSAVSIARAHKINIVKR